MLRALAAWRDARQNGGDGFNALFNLALALDADGAAHPVPVGDEGERDISPHRFNVPRGMEPL